MQRGPLCARQLANDIFSAHRNLAGGVIITPGLQTKHLNIRAGREPPTVTSLCCLLLFPPAKSRPVPLLGLSQTPSSPEPEGKDRVSPWSLETRRVGVGAGAPCFSCQTPCSKPVLPAISSIPLSPAGLRPPLEGRGAGRKRKNHSCLTEWV